VTRPGFQLDNVDRQAPTARQAAGRRAAGAVGVSGRSSGETQRADEAGVRAFGEGAA